MEFISKELQKLKEQGLFRELKIVNNKEYLIFCSNNYLGLADHPKIKEKAIKAIEKSGYGSGASRLISGNFKIHEDLENKIAKFKKREAAIIYSTGYMANVGTISSITDEKDTVIIDRLNHASIIDACRLSKAKLQVYPHKDMDALEKILKKSGKYEKRLIITDSVFSMDGDIAPLPKIVKLAKKHNALTMIDEAHATGVLGDFGRGAEEYFGIHGQIDIVMGTLSKALGGLGGFVCGKKELIEFLRNKSRSFIYSTALSPSACAAALAAIEVIENEPALIRKLKQKTDYLKSQLKELKFNIMESETQIIPLLVGDVEKTMRLAKYLFDRGIFVSGIRPPTVPKNKSRLRITVMASHTKKDLDKLTGVLKSWVKQYS